MYVILDFLDDDIDDDVKCVKKIYKEHERLSGNGFNAWSVHSPMSLIKMALSFSFIHSRVAWKSRCQGDLSEFIEGCDLEDKKESESEPKLPKPESQQGPVPGFWPGIWAPSAARMTIPKIGFVGIPASRPKSFENNLAKH